MAGVTNTAPKTSLEQKEVVLVEDLAPLFSLWSCSCLCSLLSSAGSSFPVMRGKLEQVLQLHICEGTVNGQDERILGGCYCWAC